MAFMFETRYVIRPTRFALERAQLQREYFECWQGLQEAISIRRGAEVAGATEPRPMAGRCSRLDHVALEQWPVLEDPVETQFRQVQRPIAPLWISSAMPRPTAGDCCSP